MITLDESIVGIWYMAFKDPRDIMVTVQRLGGGQYKVSYRLKQYASPEPWCTQDRVITREKIMSHSSDRDGIAVVRRFLDDLSDKAPTEGKWELLRGARSVEEFAQALIAMPCAHAKKLSAEQFDELMRTINEP